MKTSRQRLLEYIRAQRAVTVADLSLALRMTPANARHHLAILRQEGLVEVIGQRLAPAKGRPADLYSLSERGLGHNLDRLADALLDRLLANTPPEERAGLLRQFAQDLAKTGGQAEGAEPGVGTNANPPRPPVHLTQRLYAAIQRLNEMNYQARWEAHAEGPRILLTHCPYAAILADHPELCQMDASLLETLAGGPVRQTARLVPDRRGAPYCLFVLKPRTAGSGY